MRKTIRVSFITSSLFGQVTLESSSLTSEKYERTCFTKEILPREAPSRKLGGIILAMQQERADVVRVKGVQKGRLTVEIEGGGDVVIGVRRGRGSTLEPRRGLVESFRPAMQRLAIRYPRIFGADSQDFWLNLEQQQPFTPEKAAILARRQGFSSSEIGRKVVQGLIELSGTQGSISPDTMDQLIDEGSRIVRGFYIKTTEVKPGRSVGR